MYAFMYACVCVHMRVWMCLDMYYNGKERERERERERGVCVCVCGGGVKANQPDTLILLIREIQHMPVTEIFSSQIETCIS